MEPMTLDKAKKPEPLAFVGLACGRQYLSVGGIVVAMEGDPIRESDLPADIVKPPKWAEGVTATGMADYYRRCWSEQSLEWVAAKVNEAVASRLTAAEARVKAVEQERDAIWAATKEEAAKVADREASGWQQVKDFCDTDELRALNYAREYAASVTAQKIRALSPAAPTATTFQERMSAAFADGPDARDYTSAPGRVARSTETPAPFDARKAFQQLAIELQVDDRDFTDMRAMVAAAIAAGSAE